MLLDGFRRCDVPGCRRTATHYGTDMDHKPADLCTGCFYVYDKEVGDRKMPVPMMKCHRCGKEVQMAVPQYDIIMRLMDNREKHRPIEPFWVCRSCRSHDDLSWATVDNGFIIYSNVSNIVKEACPV